MDGRSIDVSASCGTDILSSLTSCLHSRSAAAKKYAAKAAKKLGELDLCDFSPPAGAEVGAMGRGNRRVGAMPPGAMQVMQRQAQGGGYGYAAKHQQARAVQQPRRVAVGGGRRYR